MERKVFLDYLPKRKDGRIDWMKSNGAMIKCIYDDEEYLIQIVEYIQGSKLKIYYDGKEKIMSTCHFVACKLGDLLNKFTSDFKVEVGTTFEDSKRNITITNREVITDTRGHNWKLYYYKCNICGWDNGSVKESALLNNKKPCGCSCCSNNTLVTGINDIATVRPDLIEYFLNKDDSKKFQLKSNRRVDLKCKNCGNKKNMRVNDFTTYGFSCSVCGFGYSVPEKFLSNTLKKINTTFECQLSKKYFNWCDKYRYDFYIPSLNTIIEVNGEQHYIETGRKGSRTLQEEQENDRLKKKLALANGISNYIEIDCRKSTKDWLKDNIIKNLGFILNLDGVDWNSIFELSINSNESMLILDKWNNKENWQSVSDLEVELGICRSSIRKYLNFWASRGMCDYNGKTEYIKTREKAKLASINSCKKKVTVYYNEEYKGTFDSVTHLANISLETFGVELTVKGISSVATGKNKTYRKFKFEYIN